MPRDEVVIATKAGISRRTGDAGARHLPRQPARHPRRARCKRLGVDHVDLWQVHVWTDETPVEETLGRARLRGEHRPRGVRRHLQLHRLADRPGRDLAARRPGPGAAGLDPGRVLAGQPQGRAGGAAGRAGARPRRAALVAARPGRAHRQVPHRHAVGLARRVPGLRRLRRRLPRRPRPRHRRGDGQGRRRPRLDAAPGRAGLGAGPARGHRADRRRPHLGAAPGRARDRGQGAAGGDLLGARRRLGRTW